MKHRYNIDLYRNNRWEVNQKKRVTLVFHNLVTEAPIFVKLPYLQVITPIVVDRALHQLDCQPIILSLYSHLGKIYLSDKNMQLISSWT